MDERKRAGLTTRWGRVAPVLALSFFLLFLFAACNHQGIPAGDYEAIYTRALPEFSFEEGEFRILQFTDLHLFGNDSNKEKRTISGMKEAIETLDPHLIVLTGDVVDGYNRKSVYNKAHALDRVGETLEESGVYWAYVNGNNDGQYLGDDRDVVSYLARFEHCLVGNEEGVEGCVNYALDILNASGMLELRLLMMDSGAWDASGDTYHGFLPTQTEWARQQASDAECAAFFHIPLKAHAAAFREGIPAPDYPHAYPNADYDVSPTSEGMEAFLTGNANVSLVSVGHVHSDNFASYYQGKYYHFGLNSGYNAGKRLGDDTGASLITVHEGGEGMARYSFTAFVYD